MDSFLRLVIFDMDGTLTVPCLDFDQVRAEIGIEGDTKILEAMEQMSPDQHRRALQILARYEEIAAADSQLHEGVHEILEFLGRQNIPTAIATRNSRQSVRTVQDKHDFQVDHVHTREDGPPKPSPDPVLSICEHFSVTPEQTCLVGDYLFDIQSGAAAGATTVLMVSGPSLPDYSNLADQVIYNLRDLIPLFENGMTTKDGP